MKILNQNLNRAVIETELEIGDIYTIKDLGRAVYMGKQYKGLFYTNKGKHSFVLVNWRGGALVNVTKAEISKGIVVHSL